MSAEQRAEQIRANLHQDMHTAIVGAGSLASPDFLDLIIDTAMFPIERLLDEIEGLELRVPPKAGHW